MHPLFVSSRELFSAIVAVFKEERKRGLLIAMQASHAMTPGARPGGNGSPRLGSSPMPSHVYAGKRSPRGRLRKRRPLSNPPLVSTPEAHTADVDDSEDDRAAVPPPTGDGTSHAGSTSDADSCEPDTPAAGSPSTPTHATPVSEDDPVFSASPGEGGRAPRSPTRIHSASAGPGVARLASVKLTRGETRALGVLQAWLRHPVASYDLAHPDVYVSSTAC